VPGPACYGQGNELPTVTDANLVLGYLADDSLAGGALTLRRELAESAIRRYIAEPAGLPLLEAAYGVHLVANSNMVRAIKSVSVERGRDPAAFAMMAFGGAGPIHAAGVAMELGVHRVLIPPSPGVFSAYGLLRAKVEQHASRSVLISTVSPNISMIGVAFGEMRSDLVARLQKEGYAQESIAVRSFADLRYRGQSSEITVPIDARAITHDELRCAEERFEEEFEQTYGHRGPNKEFEFVTCRMIATVRRSSGYSNQWADEFSVGTIRRERDAYFGERYGTLRTPVVARTSLANRKHTGPLIIQEYDTSVVVSPGCVVSLDAHGNIVMEIGTA
jgi:N-methylhydantoinase A